MNYTIEEIDRLQQQTVSTLFAYEAQKFMLYQKEVIRQLLARVKEAERVETLLRKAFIIKGRGIVVWDKDLQGWCGGMGSSLASPSLLAALESLTGE